MRLLWWRADGARRADERHVAWLGAWRQAVRARDEAALATLEAETGQCRTSGDDVEIEEEMLEAARRAIALEREISSTGLPTLTTSHRVVGADICHFTAPASLIDDPSQPSGRLLLTGSRAVFVSGPKLVQVPWHAIKDVRDDERDVLLVRAGHDGLRFRCNTYGDALSGSIVARHLLERTRRI